MPEAQLCSLSRRAGPTAGPTAGDLLTCTWQCLGHTHTHLPCRSVPKCCTQTPQPINGHIFTLGTASSAGQVWSVCLVSACKEQESWALCTDSSRAGGCYLVCAPAHQPNIWFLWKTHSCPLLCTPQINCSSFLALASALFVE